MKRWRSREKYNEDAGPEGDLEVSKGGRSPH